MDPNIVSLETEAPDILKALGDLHIHKINAELDPVIHALVLLRASQINRCAYCIDMHIKEALGGGVTQQRLDRVIVWDEVNDFTPREKVAFAWTEALTILDRRIGLQALRADLKLHFTDREIALLTAAVAMINLWNRINTAVDRPL